MSTPTEGAHDAVTRDIVAALVASAPDALYLVDAEGRIRFANPAAVAVLGYDTAEELVGRPSHATIHYRRPDGSPFPEEECPLLAPRRTGETVRVDRDCFVRRDGSMVPVAYASAPIEIDGARGAILTFRDVTAELQAEEALREQAAQQARLADVQASRARLVEAADRERRRLARDLHDGAQQQLVLALVELERARRELGSPAGQLEAGIDSVRAAIERLRELAQGIHPRVLVDHGLRDALAALADRSPFPVELDVPPERFAAPLEAAVYFLVAEALTNVAKHADAHRATVSVAAQEGTLTVEVSDDGRGGARAGAGSGLRGMADRIAALGGSFEADSLPGAGTTLRARVPLSVAAT